MNSGYTGVTIDNVSCQSSNRRKTSQYKGEKPRQKHPNQTICSFYSRPKVSDNHKYIPGQKMTTKSLSYGPANPRVLQSKGADTDLMKFYITEYSTNYDKEGFIPRNGKHQGTGYKSNFRPGVYYNRRLDELDNPTMGRLVADNYASVTKKHFLPTCGSSGADPFAQALLLRSSGFVKDIPVTIPRSNQVSQVFIDKRGRGTVYPKDGPFLQRIQPKDPISLENAGHGPKYMSTENHSRFHGIPNLRINTSRKTVGRKEGSGFTHAYNDEPITYRAMDACCNSMPAYYTSRPTGVSVMKTSFLPAELYNGRERFPILSNGSVRGTGFTREAMGKPAFYLPNKEKVFTELRDVPSLVQERMRKENPTEFINMENPHNKSSIAKVTFTGMQQNNPSLAQRLGNSTVGSKEFTGFTENNGQYFEQLETRQTLNRFKTNYGLQFFDKNPQGESRFGRTAGHVMTLPSDGFTKSTAVHDFGAQINAAKQIQNMEPYVARSIKASDPLFDDHTHHSKLHVAKPIAV